MSTMNATSSAAPQAIMVTAPLGSPPGSSLGLKGGTDNNTDSEGIGSSSTASLNGKLLNLST
jgi:hypothetical protein